MLGAIWIPVRTRDPQIAQHDPWIAQIHRSRPTSRVQEEFSHCDRIPDKTLPIVFPMEHVLSEAALLYGIRRPIYIDLHDDRRTRFRKDAPPATPPPIASEKSTQGCQVVMATLVASDDLVRLGQITMGLLLNLHNSFVKHQSQKRSALMFASSCYEK